MTRKVRGGAVLEKVEEEEPNRYSKGGNKRKSSNAVGQDKPVPPLQISQVHQLQQQI